MDYAINQFNQDDAEEDALDVEGSGDEDKLDEEELYEEEDEK